MSQGTWASEASDDSKREAEETTSWKPAAGQNDSGWGNDSDSGWDIGGKATTHSNHAPAQKPWMSEKADHAGVDTASNGYSEHKPPPGDRGQWGMGPGRGAAQRQDSWAKPAPSKQPAKSKADKAGGQWVNLDDAPKGILHPLQKALL